MGIPLSFKLVLCMELMQCLHALCNSLHLSVLGVSISGNNPSGKELEFDGKCKQI